MERRKSLMRNYELVCIIQPDLDETAFKEVVEKVKGWVAEAGGSVDKEDVWGKRKLAYLIRKQREGQYVLFNISMPADATKELERKIRFLEPVMRQMLTVV
jgi:small subunit ribosomal protein S6